MSSMQRPIATAVAAAAVVSVASLLSLGAVAESAATPVASGTRTHARAEAAHSPARARVTAAYDLPGDRVYPEGVAADPRTGDLYAGSFADGTVFKMTRGRRTAEIFLPAGADGRDTANGLEVDRAGRLWVTDSTTGVSVYDTRSRRLLARFGIPAGEGSFVNDLAITPDGSAYLTDSVRAVIYRVTPRQLARADGAHATPLTPYADLSAALEPHAPDAFTLNGIAADPFGRYLLVVDMAGGDLYRLDPVSGAVRKVVLRGGDLRHGDGLELQQGRLWVAHNAVNAISRWRVSGDGSVARRERQVTDEALQIPTTLVRRHGVVHVVRSQFDKGGPMGDSGAPGPFTIATVHGI